MQAIKVMKSLFRPTTEMLNQSKRDKVILTILVCWVVFGQLLCASGSGPSGGVDPVAGWVHTVMNVANVIIALLILIPKTRALGAILSTIILLISMSANLTFYGLTYFLKLLPFDLVFFIPSIVIYIHYRRATKAITKPEGPPPYN